MEITWTEYQSRKILYLDYRGAKTEEEMIERLEKFNDFIKSQNQKILLLTNYEGTYATPKYMEKLKERGKTNTSLIEKTAVIGIAGIKKILMRAYIVFTGENNIKVFEDEEKAKEWLVSRE